MFTGVNSEVFPIFVKSSTLDIRMTSLVLA